MRHSQPALILLLGLSLLSLLGVGCDEEKDDRPPPQDLVEARVDVEEEIDSSPPQDLVETSEDQEEEVDLPPQDLVEPEDQEEEIDAPEEISEVLEDLDQSEEIGPDSGDLSADLEDLQESRREASLVRGGPLPPGCHGLAMGPDGTLWAADTFKNMDASTSRVYRALPPSYALKESDIQGSQLSCLLADETGVWVCEMSGALRRYEDKGLVATLDASIPWTLLPEGEQGFVVVSYLDLVERVGLDGTQTTLFGGIEAAFGGALDEEGIWVSEQIPARVALRRLDGTILREVDSASLSNPEGLGIDQDGDLWIADTAASRLLRVDRATAEVVDHLETPGYPVVITTDPSTGELLVSLTGATSAWYRIELQ